MRALLELDGGASLLELGLQLVGLLALDALLDCFRRLVDKGLGLFQAESGRGAHDLDYGDLLATDLGQHDVDRGSFLLATAVTGRRASSSRSGGGYGRGRDAELLLQGLDPLAKLEHGNALQ